MATSFKRSMHTLPHSVAPTLQQANVTHTSAGNSLTFMGKSGSVSCGIIAPFSWFLVHTRFCLCPPRVCFPVLCKFWWLYGGVNGDLRRMLDATKKIRHVQGQRRSPRKMVEGGKLHLESNPIPSRDAQSAQTNLVCTRTQRCHRD